MSNRKLSIGCVLIMGGALTNCGGTVETRGDDMNQQGGTGFVGVPVGTGGYSGTLPQGGYSGTIVGGSAPTGGAFLCCPAVGGFVGTAPLAGQPSYGGDGGDGGLIGSGGWPAGGDPGVPGSSGWGPGGADGEHP
jgi:hypothetical protein